MTNTPDLELFPTLSPDGQEMAYASVTSLGTGAGWGHPGAWMQALAGEARRDAVRLLGELVADQLELGRAGVDEAQQDRVVAPHSWWLCQTGSWFLLIERHEAWHRKRSAGGSFA